MDGKNTGLELVKVYGRMKNEGARERGGEGAMGRRGEGAIERGGDGEREGKYKEFINFAKVLLKKNQKT